MKPGPIEHPWMDSSEAPLYVFVIPEVPTIEEVESFGRAREQWSRSVSAKVAFVCNLSRVKYKAVTPLHRKAFTDHMERFRAFETDHTVAAGLVATNAMVRGIITAAFWLVPPAYPHKTFEDETSARAWARELLA